MYIRDELAPIINEMALKMIAETCHTRSVANPVDITRLKLLIELCEECDFQEKWSKKEGKDG